jgi:hypothetical protein
LADASGGVLVVSLRNFLIATALCVVMIPLDSGTASAAQSSSAAREGQRDFDWEIGTWTTRVRVLRNPLSGNPPEWAEYEGTSVVKPVMGGRWNVVELSVAGVTGKIEGGSLRLYNPQARQWSLNFASLRNGLLTAPVYGSFDGRGIGRFYGSDTLDGRAILVRFVITPKSANEVLFEQAFSADGGGTWETNWIATDTRR